MVILLTAVSGSLGCSDVQLLHSLVCEHAQSHVVRREDAGQSAGSSSHFSSVSCPSFKWLLQLAEGIGMRICKGLASSSSTLRLFWKRAPPCFVGVLAPLIVAFALSPSPWTGMATLLATKGCGLRSRRVGEHTSLVSCGRELP